MSTVPQPTTTEALERAERLDAAGRTLEAIELLTDANRVAASAAIERQLAQLRYSAFAQLDMHSRFDTWPVPVADLHPDDGPATVPEISRVELSADVVRRNLLGHGCLLVRGLLDDAHVERFVSGIDRAIAVRSTEPGSDERRSSSWFSSLRVPQEEAKTLGRRWVHASGGMLAADSPKLLFQLLETYGDVGLREVIADYLGERPALSANKCTLRCVPLDASTDWHQDGAFLGRGIRSLNVWVALSECGVDSPGMDLLPRRLHDIVETGTGGAIFDWAVGPEVVDKLAVDAPVVRPVFHAGDALLFDDMFLHRTAIDPSMSRPRYAIESWFFAPSAYPSGQVPLVW